MSAVVQEILAAFDSLPAPEQDAVVGQLLLRRPAGVDDLPDAGHEELGEELFLTYDAGVAVAANRWMHGSVIFHNPDALEVSAAVRCSLKRPLAEAVVDSMSESSLRPCGQ